MLQIQHEQTPHARASSPAGPRPQYQPSPPPQTPPVRSKEGKPPTSESTAADLKRLGLDPQQVEMWASRLREWIAQEVLIPLAEKLRTADVRWRLAAQEAAAVAGDNQLLAATSAVQEGARELARATEEDARARRRREGDDRTLARVPTHRSLREGNEIFIGLAGRGWCDES